MVASIGAAQVWVWSIGSGGLGYRLGCGGHRHDVSIALPLCSLYSVGCCQHKQVIIQPYTTNICRTLVDSVGHCGGLGGRDIVAGVSWVHNVCAVLVHRAQTGGDRKDTANPEASSTIPLSRASFGRTFTGSEASPITVG